MSGNNLESGLHKLKEEGGNALKNIGKCVFWHFLKEFFSLLLILYNI